MANWKKIIVSGSDAHLNSVTASAIDVNNLQVNTSTNIDGTLVVDGLSTLGQTVINGNATITGSAVVTGSITSERLVGHAYIGQRFVTSSVTTIAVTVGTKTSNHIFFGTGSSDAYFIDGVEAPFLQLVEGVYRFDQSDSSNSGHPLRFYYEADRTTAFTADVSTNGTPGSAGAYTEIKVDADTPTKLYYQCSAHAHMGWGANFSNYNFTGKDTDDLNEGSSNLYYTNARVKAYLNSEQVLSGSVFSGLTISDSIFSGSFSGSFQGDGSQLTGLATTLTVSGSDGTGGTVNLLTQDLTVTGVTNEINTTVSGQTLTIGLPDSVSITNDLTVGGNLNVQGDFTYVNTSNLYVEDKFILLNSGSANPDEGGIVIDEGNAQGHAFVYDSDAARFAYTGSLASNATSVTPDAFAPAVVDESAGHTDKAEYQKNGNIKIDNSGEIWIYA